MKKKAEKARALGERVYIVGDNFEIRPAFVAEILCNGDTCSYRLLGNNCLVENGIHFFSFDSARAEAHRQLAEMKSDVLRRLAELEEKERELQALLSIPQDSDLPTGYSVPKKYRVPGDYVYTVVTPPTESIYSENTKPYPYFVLECKIERVRLQPTSAGDVLYLTDAHYNVNTRLLFDTVAEATAEAVRIFAEETRGTIAHNKVPEVSRKGRMVL